MPKLKSNASKSMDYKERFLSQIKSTEFYTKLKGGQESRMTVDETLNYLYNASFDIKCKKMNRFRLRFCLDCWKIVITKDKKNKVSNGVHRSTIKLGNLFGNKPWHLKRGQDRPAQDKRIYGNFRLAVEGCWKKLERKGFVEMVGDGEYGVKPFGLGFFGSECEFEAGGRVGDKGRQESGHCNGALWLDIGKRGKSQGKDSRAGVVDRKSHDVSLDISDDGEVFETESDTDIEIKEEEMSFILKEEEIRQEFDKDEPEIPTVDSTKSHRQDKDPLVSKNVEIKLEASTQYPPKQASLTSTQQPKPGLFLIKNEFIDSLFMQMTLNSASITSHLDLPIKKLKNSSLNF